MYTKDTKVRFSVEITGSQSSGAVTEQVFTLEQLCIEVDGLNDDQIEEAIQREWNFWRDSVCDGGWIKE